MADINFSQVSKVFGTQYALKQVSLEVADGEFVALLGPSGCGKTTILRLLAGFEEPDHGQISMGGRVMAHHGKQIMVPPEDRNLGIVFQSYALWPHMNVARNVGYPLEVRGMNRADRDRKVREALDIVSLLPFADRNPSDLSGGQRQRVALARCLVMEPGAVLLDEPLANLDVHLREIMQQAFLDFHRRTGATMIYVTHDQAEAMAMADRIAVMDNGHIRQMASPEQLYREPADAMVAGFVGVGSVLASPHVEMSGDGACHTKIAGNRIAVRICPKVAANTLTEKLALCLRPEDIELDEDASLRGVIEDCVYLGGRFRLMVRLDREMSVPVYAARRGTIGQQVGLRIKDGWVFENQTSEAA